MSSSAAARLGGALSLSLLAALVVGVLPARSEAAAPDCPAALARDAEPAAATEVAAQRLAAACDRPVEVLAKASETTRVVALPSGRFELESWAETHRVRRDDSWVDVDPNLVLGSDGMVRPVAVSAEVSFSAGGSGPFAVMAGKGADFTLSWPRPLPKGVITGDTITYPEVYPDVDLAVRAAAGGFSHVLVVKSAQAAANPQVRQATYQVGGSAGVTELDGGLKITGPYGVLAAAPPAMAWDSAPPKAPAIRVRPNGPAAAAAGRTPPAEGTESTVRQPAESANSAPVALDVSGDALTVTADAGLLASKHFPIFIDPAYDEKWDTWIPVNDSRPGTRWTSGTAWPRETVRVGSNWDNHSDVWRAHFQFDTTELKGKRLSDTDAPSVDAYLLHTGSCAGESIEIWQTNAIGGNTPTWNGMKGKWLHKKALQTKTGKANTTCSGQKPNWLSFNAGGIREHVQRHASANYASITFGLKMAAESGGNWARFDPKNVKLKAVYDNRPHSPVAIRSAPGGACNRAAPGPWINDRRPALFGRASDGDGTVQIVFDLTGPTNPPNAKSAGTKSGVERGWTAPTLAEGNYNWRIQGTDGKEDTAWTPLCHFRLDHTGPTPPRVERVSGTPQEGAPVTLRLTSTDARSGVKQFSYGIGVDAMQKTELSTGTKDITFTPGTGRTVVYVWAQDNAGNLSARTAFNFYTGRVTEAESRGVWRLNGDAQDDSGADHHLTVLGDGVGYGPNRKEHTGSALALTGSGCTGTGAVVRGDAEMTVAGWAKLTDRSQYRAVAAQVGTRMAGFMLTYNPTRNGWEAAVSSGDTDTPQWAVAFAPTTAPTGQWQHLAATVDPVAKVLRLYVDGRLAAESDIGFPTWHGENFRVGCAGSGAGGPGYVMHGSVDDVGVWQGLLSDQQIARSATELPAGLVGNWQLRGSGTETTGRSPDVALPESASWVDDQFGRPESAAWLSEGQCATATASVLRTDESFAVAAWVKAADAGGGNQTFVGQDGTRISGFYLGTQRLGDAPATWRFMMGSADSEESQLPSAAAPHETAPVQADTWTHLTGVYDAAARTLNLYVNGRLAATAPSAGAGWNAAGPLTIGCGRWQGAPADQIRGAAVSDVRAWRGALTAAQVTAVHGGNPAVRAEGSWPLNGPSSDDPTLLTDVSGNARDLSITGDYSWVEDRTWGQDGALALQLAENSCAQTAGPVLRTDTSFTVAAWVLLDDVAKQHTVLSQADAARGGFHLDYNPELKRWAFAMPSSGVDGAVVWSTATSLQTPAAGTWTHLAGVYDVATNTLRLYVDGVLNGEATGPAKPWSARGPLLVGCAGSIDGQRWTPLGGAVDAVRVWTSTVHPDRIAGLAAS